MLIDFWIFGNGHGIAAPRSNQVFLWMSGRFYTWIGGFGAQLQSFEWRCPRPGTRRILKSLEFEVFDASRRWFKWRVSWRQVGAEMTMDQIRALRRELL